MSTNSETHFATGVKDNVNTGGYAQAGSNVLSGSSSAQIWYQAAASNGATTITVTMNTNVEWCYWFFDLGGAASSSVLETSAVLTNQSSAANPHGPSVAVVGTADFICSAICTITGATAVNASTGAPTGSWTGAFPDAANTGSGFAYDNSTGSGTYFPAWTMTSGTWGGVTAAFKAAVSAVVVPGWKTPTAGPSYAI